MALGLPLHLGQPGFAAVAAEGGLPMLLHSGSAPGLIHEQREAVSHVSLKGASLPCLQIGLSDLALNTKETEPRCESCLILFKMANSSFSLIYHF